MITIVIPTFNRLSWLQKCLFHLNNQNSSHRFEVIIIDDGSTDETNTYLTQNKNNFSFQLVHLSQKNRGPAVARNYGINTAKGHIIGFLDDDSMVESSWIKEMATSFEGLSENYAAVKGRTIMYGHSNFGAFLQENFDDSDSWITNNIAYRRKVLIKVGLLDEKNFTMAAWEDLDLAYRVQRAGYKRFYNEKAVVSHPREENINQLTNRYRINGYGFYQFIRKWICIEPIFVAKIFFWELTKIHYMFPFMKHINYLKYLKGLRLAYQINGLIHGIRFRGNFQVRTRDIT